MPEKVGSPLLWIGRWLLDTGQHLSDMRRDLFVWWSEWLGEWTKAGRSSEQLVRLHAEGTVGVVVCPACGAEIVVE